MDYPEYKLIREYLQKKSVELMDHEEKPHTPVGWPAANYELLSYHGRKFVIIKTNVFRNVIEDVLPQACKKFPEKFGTENGEDVIDALYAINPWGERNDYGKLLGGKKAGEQFCYAIEVANGVVVDKILRIDLFREYTEGPDGKYYFTGGIFHAFNHFSYNGCPLSIRPSKHDLTMPENLVIDIVVAFFTGDFVENKKNTITVTMPYDEKKVLSYVFYPEKVTGVYFVNTVTQTDI